MVGPAMLPGNRQRNICHVLSAIDFDVDTAGSVRWNRNTHRCHHQIGGMARRWCQQASSCLPVQRIPTHLVVAMSPASHSAMPSGTTQFHVDCPIMR